MQPFHVRSLRGAVEDSRHTVHAVVMAPDGRTVASWGEASLPVLSRSAAKPLQAIPVVRAGVMEKYGLSTIQLAAICSSHNSQQFQVDVVQDMLERVGGTEDDLVCRPHRPLIKDLGYHLPGDESDVTLASPGRLSSNCSGKHTGMVALARATGATVDGYEQPGHPVQQAGREVIAECCGVAPDDLGTSIDGCGVVCWSLTLGALAVGYARLATSDDDAVARVRQAMMDHPEYVAGDRRLCTAIMRAAPGAVLAKIGAGGVYGAALAERRLGVAVKVVDGNSIAAGVALLAILNDLAYCPGLVDRLEPYARPAILNTLGDVVGHYEAGGRLSLD